MSVRSRFEMHRNEHRWWITLYTYILVRSMYSDDSWFFYECFAFVYADGQNLISIVRPNELLVYWRFLKCLIKLIVRSNLCINSHKIWEKTGFLFEVNKLKNNQLFDHCFYSARQLSNFVHFTNTKLTQI